MKLIHIIAGVVIVLGIFIAFGQTFITMATDKDQGYDVPIDNNLKNTFMNSTKSKIILIDYQDLAYNTSNSLQTGKSKVYNEYYDVQQQVVNVVNPFFYFSLLDFARRVLVSIFSYLQIPSVYFGIVIIILIFVVIFAAAKIILGREL